MAEKIMLIDGNSIINRAFFALPAFTNSKGEHTGGVYGFLNIFFKLYDEEKPNYVAVAFDLHHPTVRHEKYGQYKGTRSGMPEELRPQIPMLKELLALMGIPCYEKQGFEADDILGTLAKKGESEGYDVVVVSGDRDLLQIAADTIKIRIPKTKGGKTEVEDYFKKDVIEKYGVTPEEFIDVKALMGDASDNIPGVPGIGEKTALKIIMEYKNLDMAIENAADIKPKKASENMIAFKDQAYLSKDLATIITDADVDLPKDKLTEEEFFNDNAILRLNELGFKSLVNKVSKPLAAEASDLTFHKVTSLDKIKELALKLLTLDRAAIDLIIINGINCGASFYYEENGFFLPFDTIITEQVFAEEFSVFFTSDVKKITFDSKKLRAMLLKHNICPNNILFDSVLAAYVLNSSKSSYTYDGIGADFLGVNYPSEESIFGKGKTKLTIENADEQSVLNFCCRQTEVAYKSYPVMNEQIARNGQNMLYYNIELPTAEVLASLQNYGIKVNKAALMEFDALLSENIDILTREIYELSGEIFNINSPQQLGIVLFEKLGLKGGKKTKTGYSTAVDILERLKYKHPVIGKVLLYRTLSKLKSTYCDGLLNVLDDKTQKIYSTFNQTVTSTGRLSSTEPNLQNIPIRMDLGRQLRKIFIPSDDSFVFADADYSQIELRVLAHIAQDDMMINAFMAGADIHRTTASQVHKINIDEVTPSQRSAAKAVNFGIVYGIGAFSLSEDLGISKKEAEDYINTYLDRYPGVKAYMAESVEKAKQNGYAETIFNRRREILELKNSNFNLRSFGERVAMNMPIQGSAADIMKLAMIKVYNRLKEEDLKSRIILQVHDELLLEVKVDEIEKVCEILKHEMENCVSLSVPLLAEVNTGKTWFDTK